MDNLIYGVLSGTASTQGESCRLTDLMYKGIEFGTARVIRNLEGKCYEGESAQFHK